jgi:hypothetical protein
MIRDNSPENSGLFLLYRKVRPIQQKALRAGNLTDAAFDLLDKIIRFMYTRENRIRNIRDEGAYCEVG